MYWLCAVLSGNVGPLLLTISPRLRLLFITKSFADRDIYILRNKNDVRKKKQRVKTFWDQPSQISHSIFSKAYTMSSPPPHPALTPLPTYTDIRTFYINLVTHIVPGPLSISYFIPLLLLPAALMIPRSTLSHHQLIAFFMVPIVACECHAWYVMGGVDVISVDVVLWAAVLVCWDDARGWKRLWGGGEVVEASVVVGGVGRGEGDEKAGGQGDEHEETTQGDDESTPVPTSPSSAKTSPLPTCHHQHYHTQPHPTPLPTRALWTLNLLSSTRLHRWLTTSRTHNRRQLALLATPPPTRLRFSLALLPGVLLNLFVLLPLTTALARWDRSVSSLQPSTTTAFLGLGTTTAKKPLLVAIIQDCVPPFILKPLTHGIHAYALLTLGHNLPAPLICFSNYLFGNYLLGFPADTWSPHTLPAYFGGFAEVVERGVGGLWGGWWHGHMRVLSVGPGEALAEGVGWGERVDDHRSEQVFEQGKGDKRAGNKETKDSRDRKQEKGRKGKDWKRYALLVLSSFFSSGLMHTGLVPPQPLHTTTSPTRLRLHIALFFWSQAFAVLLECFIATLFRNHIQQYLPSPQSGGGIAAVNVLRKVVVLAWVLAWLSTTLPLLAKPFDELGWWRLWVGGVGALELLLERLLAIVRLGQRSGGGVVGRFLVGG